MIQVDDLTVRLLELLAEKYQAEPLRPEHDMPEGQAAETAARHAEWYRSVAALRALTGVRLVNEALLVLDREGEEGG